MSLIKIKTFNASNTVFFNFKVSYEVCVRVDLRDCSDFSTFAGKIEKKGE